MTQQTAVSIDIRIPTPLRAYTDQKAAVSVQGSTVGEALQDLVRRHPDLKSHLYNDDGRLRSFINVFRNDDDIRHLDRENTRLRESDDLSIIPSIAGG